jgi:hypothetical protein
LGAAAGYGILKGEDVAVSAAQKKIWGKEYIAGPWEGIKLMGGAAATTSKGWNPLAGEWGDWSKWGDVWKAATGKYEEVKEGKRVEEVSKTENFNININTINTQATDGAELAGELKKQARRTGKKKSP